MSGQQRPRVDEEEDLDDLDDVLDQFSKPTSPPPQASSAGASTSTQPSAQPAGKPDDPLTDEFAAQLAEEMASLFKGLGIEPGAGSGGTEGLSEREGLAAAWEAVLVEGMDAMTNTPAPAETASPKSKEDDFQSRIRSTMNKLKESESGLKSSTDTAAGGDDKTLEALLSQLNDLGGLPGEGEQSEEHFQEILEGMMGQLMSKEVLYEPLKELHDKFPSYLAEHSGTLSTEDKARYEAQILCIKRLVDEFDAKTYCDDDAKAREKIVELMGELQAHGSPPEEIMGPLPPGFDMGSDGLPNMPEGCTIS